MEYIDAWNKYKHGIWIITGIAAVIGIAGGPIGIIFFAFFGFCFAYLFDLILFLIKESPEERAAYKKKRIELRNSMLEKQQAKKKAKQKAEEERQAQRNEQIKKWQTEDLSKRAGKVDGLVLKKNVYWYLAISVLINWKEDRSKTRRVNYGGLTSSIHIAKGLNYRLGSVKTDIQKENYIVTLFTGALFLTNKRIILVNKEGSKAYPFTRLLRATPYRDGVALYSNAGKRVILDGFSDAEKFNIYLDRLLSEDDILPHLEEKETMHTEEKVSNSNKDESRSQFSKEFAELRELKTLLDDKIITQEEFEAKKKQLLDL